MSQFDVHEFDELNEATVKGWDHGAVMIEAAFDRYGAWEFDATTGDGETIDLTDAQYAAAVRVANEPENAECERGTNCVNQRPALIVDGEVRRYSPDFIGFHLTEDPYAGYERMAFKPFWVTAAGTAICDECADECAL